MLQSTFLVLFGNASGAILNFARNILVAWMLPVADFGIAATFAVVIAAAEISTAFGLQQKLIQSPRGDDLETQSVIQGIHLVRGVISCAVLLVIAEPIAVFMRLPEITWAYQVLALTPAIGAVAHFDIHRFTRKGKFLPIFLCGFLPNMISLLAVFPLFLIFGDFRTMLAVIIFNALLSAAATHIVSERRYRIGFNGSLIREILSFGWPLLINSALLFTVFHGDKLIVAREMGVEALAMFAMGLTLSLTPALVITKSMQGLLLPVLSRRQDSKDAFQVAGDITIETAAVCTALLTILIAVGGEHLLVALFGDKFNALLPLLSWLAVASGIRMLKAAPSLVSLALGDTRNMMYSNFPRLLLLPLAWYLAATSKNLEYVILVAIFSEFLGLALAMKLLESSSKGFYQIAYRKAALPCAALALCVAWATCRPIDLTPQWPPLWILSALGVCCLIAVAHAARITASIGRSHPVN